jgi:hypothetical protein
MGREGDGRLGGSIPGRVRGADDAHHQDNNDLENNNELDG